MNSDVHPIIVAVVLALTASAVAMWIWASGEAASIGGPAELKSGPDGHHYVQIQNSLVEHDAQGNYVKTHDLEELGVDLFLGSYAFFSNGDVLLRLGPDPRSFGDNLRAYWRKTNHNAIAPESPDSGLYRCNLDKFVCDRFGSAGIDIKAAYGIFVNWRTDDVYIADTTRHVLRKYSADGDELAKPTAGFRFPNHLLLRDDQLLVADTNHHVIRIVSPDSPSFADLIETIDVVPDEASSSRQTWPSHFTRVGSEWWVNNMQTGMNNGGLYVFDDNWRYVRNVDLPEGADPISLLPVNDQVWVSDWENDRVRRFSTSGEALPDLDSAGLEAILASSRQERRRYDALGYGGVAVFALVLLGLAVRAFAVSMTTGPKTRPAKTENEAAFAHDALLFLQPDDKALRRMATAVRVAGLLAMVIFALAVYIVYQHGAPGVAIRLILAATGLLAIVLLIAWVNNANVGTSVTLDGNHITLRDHTGRDSTCTLSDVRYDDTAIATKDAVVFLGRPMAWVYERKSLQEQLLPRLVAAQKVTPWTMMQIFMKLRHPQGLVTVAVVAGLVAYLVYLAAERAGGY